MKYWDFEDWAIFGLVVLLTLCLLAVFVPLIVLVAKEMWTLVFS